MHSLKLFYLWRGNHFLFRKKLKFFPITRPELEQIRGVNCSLILRNLMMRGLVKEAEDPSGLLPKYEVTTDYLRHLGVTNLNELPEYEKLHNHEHINITLSQTSESAS